MIPVSIPRVRLIPLSIPRVMLMYLSVLWVSLIPLSAPGARDGVKCIDELIVQIFKLFILTTGQDVNSIGELNLQRSLSAVHGEEMAIPTTKTNMHPSFIGSLHRQSTVISKIFRCHLRDKSPPSPSPAPAPARPSRLYQFCHLRSVAHPRRPPLALSPAREDPRCSISSLPSPPRRRTP